MEFVGCRCRSGRTRNRRLHVGRLVYLKRGRAESRGSGHCCTHPRVRKDVMADPVAAAELQVKRTHDFDDVVRDYRKRVDLANLGFQFNRDCGKAIEAIMAKPAPKP